MNNKETGDEFWGSPRNLLRHENWQGYGPDSIVKIKKNNDEKMRGRGIS